MKTEIKIIFLLFFLTNLFFWKVILNPGYMLYPAQDVMEQYSLWKFLIHDTFEKYKELPLWNPWYFSGHPFVSNLLSSMFYPINFLYLFFNPDLVFNYIFLLDIFLVGVFTFLFSKEIGLDNWSSLFSSLTFMFSFYFADHIFAGHLANIDAIIWMPLTLLFTELIIKKRELKYSILLSIALSLQILAGHIQHSFYSNMALLIYFVLRIIQERDKSCFKMIFLFFSAFIFSILISSVQLIPSFEFLFYSVRSGGLSFEEASMFSLPPYQLVGFLAPEFFGSPRDQSYWGGRNFFELTAYIGILSFILMTFAIFFNKSKYVKIFLSIIIFSLFFAFGKYTPFYTFFYKYVPGVNLFRIPSTTLFIYVFSASILSGFGFYSIFENWKKPEKSRFMKFKNILIICCFLIFISIIILVVFREKILEIGEKILFKKYQIHSKDNILQTIDYYSSKISLSYSHIKESLIILSIFLSISTFLINLRLNSKISLEKLKILFILVLIFDLFLFWQKYIIIVKPQEIYEKPKIEETDISDIITVIKKEDGKFRVYDPSDWTIPQHIAIRNEIELIHGYDLSKMGRYREFTERLLGYQTKNNVTSISKALGMLNGKYIVTHEKIEDKNFVLVYETNRTIKMMPRAFITASKYESNQTYVYKNKKFLPRAYLVPNAEVVDKDKILTKISSDDFDPKKTVLFEEKIDFPLKNDGEFKEVDIIFYSPNKIIVQTNSSDPSFLVLSELWYPGWMAFEKGKEIKIFRVNYIFRGIYIPEGEHEIYFVFYPMTLKVGIITSLLTSLFLIIIYIKNKR